MRAQNSLMNGHAPHQPHREPIDAYLAHLQRQRLSERTIETYRRVLYRAHDEIPGGLVGAHDIADRPLIETWLACPTWSAATQNLYTIALQRFYRWLHQRGYLQLDPAAEIERPKRPRRVPRPASRSQVGRILTYAREPVRLWSLIAAHSGARAVEISRLHRDHITQDSVRLWGKGDAERMVPSHAAVWEAVRGLPPGPITDLDPQIISIRCHREYRRIGVLTSIHKLRTYFATELRRAGVDLRVIQELLGHRSLATTEAYLGVNVTELTDAVARLPVLVDEATAPA